MTDQEARLRNMLSASEWPTLTDGQIADLLAMSRLADAQGNAPDALASWTATTAYSIGDEVVPSVRNGHKYRVTGGTGSSAGSEPDWPIVSGGTVVDSGLTWTEVGTAPWTPIYNLNIGAAEGWLWKAGMVANRHDFSQEFRNMNRSQMHAMFMKNSERYRRRIIGSIRMQSQVAVASYDPIVGNLNNG